MKKRIAIAILLALLPLMAVSGLAQAAEYEIDITQIVEHPALDAVRQGFKDQLAEMGVDATYNDYIAQGSMDLAIQIASQMMGESPDLVMAIATPTAQAAAQKVRGIPILFTAITDPVAAGLVKSLDAPGGPITGMTDKSPVDRQMDLIQEIVPGVKRLGFIYNAGEANSVVSFGQAEEEAAKRGITMVPRTVSTSAEVSMAAKSLVGQVDAIHVPTDNTVITALEAIVKVSEEADIPLFAADTDSVTRGAIAAIAIDYYQMGRQTGEMAKRILVDGADPATMPVETLRDLELFVNPGAAERMGIALPATVLDRADTVVK